ncbi:Atxe2 family lasso peptide isopeptidase [Sphingopyxis sp. 22461]
MTALACMIFAGGIVQAAGKTVDTSVARVNRPSCQSLQIPERVIAPKRTVITNDLIRLRDFGGSEIFESGAPGFALSPDGQHLAVQVRQAEPSSNSYCQGLMLFSLAAENSAPELLDEGGEFARGSFELYGLNGFPAGTPVPLTPRWSPDGRWIAFLRRDEGVTRLWIVSPKGGAARALTDSAADVVEFKWKPSAILEYARDEQLRAARAGIAEEGKKGFLYDDRFWMVAELHPYPRGQIHNRVSQIRVLEDGNTEAIVDLVSTKPASGVIIETEPGYGGQSALRARIHGRDIPCVDPSCKGIAGAWMLSRGNIVIFVRREGFANSQTAIYRWDVEAGQIQKLRVVDDAIGGCDAGARLICGRETSLNPRDIVEVDPETGGLTSLIDLNPEWDNLVLAGVTRLHWTNEHGTEVFGDLILPTSMKGGEKFPLVVVQYNSRGFLRGGTGDEYPVQAMAAQGFAVLSFNRPPSYRFQMMRAGRPFSVRDLMVEWKDRAFVHDALMKGLDLVVSRYPIDTDHLAITGLSDGGSTATYALIHSRRFGLALLSTCCEDPSILETAVGPAYIDFLKRNEYPLPSADYQESWRRVSLAMNADAICARIVIQTADREARAALAAVSALREHGRDIAMYIFPDEYHVKWQPAHRSAIYLRTLDELNRWKGEKMPSCQS